jgi:plasmid stability protein
MGFCKFRRKIDCNAVTVYIWTLTFYTNTAMPTLTIRNLPDQVHSALRLKAAQDGLSMEAEARKILTEACKIDKKSPTCLQQLVDQLYDGKKPANVVENLIQERRAEANRE